MLSILLATQVAAQSLCGPTPDVLAAFERAHKERPVWTGRTAKGVLTLLESRRGTFTVLFSPSPGVSCALDAGTNSNAMFGEPV